MAKKTPGVVQTTDPDKVDAFWEQFRDLYGDQADKMSGGKSTQNQNKNKK